MRIEWDVVEGQTVTETNDGLDITRPICVVEMPSPCVAGASPQALLQALGAPGMPVRGTPHSTSFPLALLAERRIRSIKAVDAVMVDLVYRQKVITVTGHGDATAWTLTDATQTTHIQVFASADGSKRTEVWYKPFTTSTASDNSPPAGARVRVAPTHRIQPFRVIKATATLTKADWDTWKAQVRAAAGKINSDVWNGEARGTWLFLGPTTTYADSAQLTVKVELVLMNDPLGHFPIVAFVDEHGVHPADSDLESTLRSTGPPAEGKIIRRNGLTWVSEYKEVAFTGLFIFSPV